MLLMKDRSFLYELSAYLIYVKVGEMFSVHREHLDKTALITGITLFIVSNVVGCLLEISSIQ